MKSATSTTDCYVLIVDDDPDVCAFIREVLEGEGYRTRTVVSGEAARERLGRIDPR